MPYIQTNGITLYYQESGTGEPLLLIMGITAAGSVWEKHLAYWQKYFRCICIDNRGVGLSDKPSGPYTTAQMADDCAGLLDALELSNVRVIGCSMGSTIAQQLAIRHPGKVHSLVLMCPWARCDNTAKAIFEHMVHCKQNLSPRQFMLFIQLLIFSKSYWDNEAAYQDMLEARIQADMEPNPQPLHGLQGQAAACVNHNVLTQLQAIELPALIIGGRADIFTPVWMAEEVAAAIKNAQLYLYEGAGHAFHWEMIDDFNPRIKNWLLETHTTRVN